MDKIRLMERQMKFHRKDKMKPFEILGIFGAIGLLYVLTVIIFSW